MDIFEDIYIDHEQREKNEKKFRLKIKSIIPTPNPKPLVCLKRDVLKYKNIYCKHYRDCMNFVECLNPLWENWKCTKCYWKGDSDGKIEMEDSALKTIESDIDLDKIINSREPYK